VTSGCSLLLLLPVSSLSTGRSAFGNSGTSRRCANSACFSTNSAQRFFVCLKGLYHEMNKFFEGLKIKSVFTVYALLVFKFFAALLWKK
jgi:hypothetical protein